jgi:cytoplasmic iron level regulating protein YaaA (DUF328/UPF0246 family)
VLLLLPPSETKRDGGDGGVLDLSRLAFPGLAELRAEAIARTIAVTWDADAAMRALKLGPRQIGEVERNRALLTAPTMPAIDRYSGVLYDALAAPRLDPAAREYAARTVVVHSALLGPVAALDEIPPYRLSHDSRLPGLPLKRHWRAAIGAELAAHGGLIVDLRSEGYVELGPAPRRDDSVFVRVVSVDDRGRRRALNHFNKRTKGLFTRALLEQRPGLHTTADLLDWASGAGFRLQTGGHEGPAQATELELVAA